jgi:hypothetical protein
LFCVKDILIADFNKNHQGRAYSQEYVLSAYDKYVSLGGLSYKSPNVIIIYQRLGDLCVFHCFSGGSGKDLTEAINSFLKSIAVEYDRAATYYDNPRINEIAHYSVFPATINKIDEGEDRTFEMEFNLRSA